MTTISRVLLGYGIGGFFAVLVIHYIRNYSLDWHLISRMALPVLLYAMAAWFIAKAVKTFMK